jgi:hypothetical protein
VVSSTTTARRSPHNSNRELEHFRQVDCTTNYFEYRRCTFTVTITHSPITLGNLSSINLVFIFRYSSPPRNPVYVRSLDHFSSHPIPPTQKKNQCLLPESDSVDSLIPQSTPEQTREKTPIIRILMKLLLSMLTKPSFHQRIRNTTRLCAPCSDPSVTKTGRRSVPSADVATGWAEGNRSLSPVRVPSHTSVHHPPPWRRVDHLLDGLTTSFKFTQESLFFFPPFLMTKSSQEAKKSRGYKKVVPSPRLLAKAKKVSSSSVETNCGKEKQVKLLKIDFQKVEREHIFQVFGQLDIRKFSCRGGYIVNL